MTTEEIRNRHWRRVRRTLQADCLRVHNGYREHGPCTTRALAYETGIPLLTVRPRTTNLKQAGLIELVGKQGCDGVYGWVDPIVVVERATRRENFERSQLTLPLA